MSISSSSTSSESSDNEPLKHYKPGGYHPVKFGEVFNKRYKAVEKVGWGHFSLVWKVKDNKRKKYKALKIVKSKINKLTATAPHIATFIK